MIQKRLKILSLMITLLLSTSLMLYVTYAWFSTNSSVDVNNIHIQARVSEKILVSTDAIKWKGAITLNDIMNADYIGTRKNQIPVNFQAYSSGAILENGYMKMYSGFVSMETNPTSENYKKLVLTSLKEEEQDGYTGGFLTFDLYFKSDSVRPIYLGKKSVANYVGSESGIASALRIAFIREGSLIDESQISAIQGLKTSDNKNVTIWEPNCNQHNVNGIKNALETYGITINEDSSQLSYYGIKNEITTPIPLNSQDDNYFSLMTSSVCTPNNYMETQINKYLFTIDQGITKVRVYVWVEGQDVDCENSSSGTDFEFNINFTTKVEES